MSVEARKWINIDDFSPGIYSVGTWEIAGTGTAGKTVPGAPLGSAQETNTYSCVPTSNGRGLMPGPRPISTRTVDFSGLTGAANVQVSMITGIFPILGTATSTIFPCWIGLYTWETAGGGSRGRLFTTNSAGTGFAESLVVQNAAAPNPGTTSRSTMAIHSTLVNATAPYLTPGQMVAAFSSGDPISSIRIYPVPGSPGPSGTTTLWTGASNRAFVHQNRVLNLSATGVNVVIGGGGVYAPTAAPGAVQFTDPANSPVPGTNITALDVENYSGFGAASSLNANTLLLVKASTAGGVVVQGDIANPIVTSLPAITGTNFVTTDTCAIDGGVVYVSGNNGMHMWSGGAQSTKISKQLQNDFYDAIPSAPPNTTAGYGVGVKRWGDFLFTSNNWLMHIETGGWWRIEPTSTWRGLYPAVNAAGRYALSTSSVIGTSALSASYQWGRQYDNQLRAVNWSWQSQPIPVTIERMVGVDEIIVTCQGAGTIQFTGTSYTGSTSGADNTVTPPVTVTLPAEAANQPVKIRVPFSIMGYNIVIRMVADNGSNNAPIVDRLDIAYDDTNLVAVQ